MTEHEIIRPVFGVLLGLGGAVLLLPAYRLTAYSADRIEFKALRCYTDLDHTWAAKRPGRDHQGLLLRAGQNRSRPAHLLAAESPLRHSPPHEKKPPAGGFFAVFGFGFVKIRSGGPAASARSGRRRGPCRRTGYR